MSKARDLAASTFTDAITASGGIYLGGTGSANLQDDYEEGEFQVTVTCVSGSVTLLSTEDTLSYTKIGNRVFVSGQIRTSAISSPSGGMKINMPFAVGSGSETSEWNVGILRTNGAVINAQDFGISMNSGSDASFFVLTGQGFIDPTSSHIDSNTRFYINFSYRTS